MAVERKECDGRERQSCIVIGETGSEQDRWTQCGKQRQGQEKLMEVAVWIQPVSQTRSEPDRQNTRGKGTKKWWMVKKLVDGWCMEREKKAEEEREKELVVVQAGLDSQGVRQRL